MSCCSDGIGRGPDTASIQYSTAFAACEAGGCANVSAYYRVSFDMDEKEINWYSEHVMDASDRRYYVATLGDSNTYIGKIDVSLSKRAAIIYGFGVLPEYRGCGYGRQMLMQTIQDILATGQHHIVLEVATQNKNALSLYQSCGFRETGSYDYYSLEV